MNFQKYQHIVRYGEGGVRGIELGTCYVFPKIDGTNSSVWLKDDGTLGFGGRNHEVTVEVDNQQFAATLVNDSAILAYLQEHPDHRLYGEWLVPHTIKNYEDSAWKKFYIFDVAVPADNVRGHAYLPYEVYAPLLAQHGLNYIEPLGIVKNGNIEDFAYYLEKNNFLIKKGEGFGEGIVIKNYAFTSKSKTQLWAKIVTAEFKAKHFKKEVKPEEYKRPIEEVILDEFVTEAFIEKEYAKLAQDGAVNFGDLVRTIWQTLIDEEMLNILKAYKNPVINFKKLNGELATHLRVRKPDLFDAKKKR